MLFNSLQFAILLPGVLIIYWLVLRRNLKLQNILLLAANYLFYAWWDWRFLVTIIIFSIFNYCIGREIFKQGKPSIRKLYLLINIIVSIGTLFFFRYYNYFADGLVYSLSKLGIELSQSSLEIILPLGISIYSLQALSYSIEIYRKKLKPSGDLIAFFAYVSFFPQMFMGPIEKATALLPQFSKKKKIDSGKIKDGLKQILWGFFKKMVIANNCAIYSNEIFLNYDHYKGFTIFTGLVFFAFQIYAELSGISDIAIGVAKLFGFKLTTNFRFPYFSKNLNEFWSKWNISLMVWLKEYVYSPLGGMKGNIWLKSRNMFILFFLIGLWHGGNGPFILFGIINMIFLLPAVMRTGKLAELSQDNLKSFPGFKDSIQYSITFLFVLIALTFFRAETLTDAVNILKRMFTSFSHFSILELRSLGNSFAVTLSHVIILLIYIIIEWIGRDKDYALDYVKDTSASLRWFLIAIILIMLLFFNGVEPQYQYFTY